MGVVILTNTNLSTNANVQVFGITYSAIVKIIIITIMVIMGVVILTNTNLSINANVQVSGITYSAIVKIIIITIMVITLGKNIN